MAKWREIEDYPNYMVSEDGQVMRKACTIWTKKGTRRLSERMLSTDSTVGQYRIVVLYRDGEHKAFYIHRLVAKAFVPNPKQLPCVNHIDYDTSNNRASNLEWCTYGENVRHSAQRMRKPHKTRVGAVGEKYISMIGEKYRVSLRRKGYETIDKQFMSLEEAIEYRDKVLEARNEINPPK